MPATLPNAETDTPERSLNVSVNGQDGAANTTLTDGTRNVNVGLPHHNIYIPPAETIESVNITTGSMDAEEGMAAGVAITVITKSGTNTFKGSAFEFFNNEKLNANPYYFGRGAIPAKLPIERQTFGGTLGGPILRNQLFFFGSYEGYLGRQNLFAFFNVPNAALRNGDFSGALNANGTHAADLRSAHAATWPRGPAASQFENNVIPASRINAISRQLQALYPLPNVEGTGAGRPDRQLPDDAPQRDGPPQLRPEDQLEPDARASALGQVQPHERARRRSVHLPAAAAPMATAARRKSISSPAGRPGRSASRCSSTARSASRCSISSAARPTSTWG